MHVQAAAARTVAEVLAWPGAAVVQVDLTTPPPTPAGRPQPPIAARIRSHLVGGGPQLDVLVSLVGDRARRRHPDARPAGEVAALVETALLDRPLICWSAADLAGLRTAVPHPDWPRADRYAPQPRAYLAETHSMLWRAQLDDRRRYMAPLPPGTPDRLLLHLRRIAATATPASDNGSGSRRTPPGDYGRFPVGCMPSGGMRQERSSGRAEVTEPLVRPEIR